MTNRVYCTAAMLGTAAIDEMINSTFETTPTQEEFESRSASYRAHMIAALEDLDDRFWWEPETSTLYWQDDGSDAPLPDPYTFEDWWQETTSAWIASPVQESDTMTPKDFITYCIQHHEDFPDVGEIDLDSARAVLENIVPDPHLPSISPEDFVTFWNAAVHDPEIMSE